MSNPWETSNPWGKGTKEWNRWMAPDEPNSDKISRPQLAQASEPLRNVYITVTGETIGTTRMSSYPAEFGKMYEIPTYRMTVSGTDHEGDAALEDFEVQRFGVHYNPTDSETGRAKFPSHPTAESPRVAGLADSQAYVIREYMRLYTGARSPAWRVPVRINGALQSGFLIHDGPDNPTLDNFRNLGCIAVCGEREFDRLNGLIRYLSGTSLAGHEACEAIAAAGALHIEYLRATRPSLVLWED